MKFSQPPGMPPGMRPGMPPGMSPGMPPGMPSGMMPGPGPSPGSIRNTLGSGLKSSGFFQKDGQIQNMRGGFLGPKQPQFNPQYNPQYSPQYSPYASPNLEPSSYGTRSDAGSIPNAGMPGRGMPGQGVSNQGMFNQGAANQGRQPVEMQSGGGKMGKGPFSFLGGNGLAGGFPQTRQLILQPAGEGIAANGVATITPDNTFFMVANLPPPNAFQTGIYGDGRQGNAVYATYLVDKKGKRGFLAGILSPVGNGVYRAQFRSPVPLDPYERVIVSVENPQRLGQVPAGAIILKVKEPAGPGAFFKPFQNAAGSVWNKISGLTKRGVPAPIPVPVPAPEVAAPGGLAPEAVQQTVNAAGSAVPSAPAAPPLASPAPPVPAASPIPSTPPAVPPAS